MKIKRVFEGSLNSDDISLKKGEYYTEMDGIYYYDKDFEEGLYHPISNNELSIIIGRIPNILKGRWFTGYVLQINGKNIENGYLSIYVKKDDWYYLKISADDYSYGKSRYIEKYFKCDQFEGLLKCLNDDVKNL